MAENLIGKVVEDFKTVAYFDGKFNGYKSQLSLRLGTKYWNKFQLYNVTIYSL